MLKMTLSATTALVLCVSVAFAGPDKNRPARGLQPRFMKFGATGQMSNLIAVPPVRASAGPRPPNVSHWLPGATFNNFSRDKNAEFISWYGFGIQSQSYSCSFNFCVREIASEAIAITGTGKKVKKIVVPLVSFSSLAEFNVGIFSATASGLPGNHELAGGTTTASYTNLCCTSARSVDVNITLTAGQKYFVEVSCAPTRQSNCYGLWLVEDADFSGDAQDYLHLEEIESWTSGGTRFTYTISSPWHLSTEHPIEPAAIVK